MNIKKFFLIGLTSLFFTISESIKLFHNKSINNQYKLISKKYVNFNKLIRSNNILPTILLNVAGGWIVNPNINLFRKPLFGISVINTLCIMSGSMIINDICDINIDKINSPNKPLVNKSISLKEAYFYLFSLFGISEILALIYLPKNMKLITHMGIINGLIYTPILKKIPLIKNISCSFLVVLGIIYSAFSLNMNELIYKNKNLLFIFCSAVFSGSLYNEILLDILDKEGDKINNINTLPVIFGNNVSINILFIILYTLFLNSSFLLLRLYSYNISTIYSIICIYLFFQLEIIILNNYSREIIINSVKNTHKILLLLVIFIGGLSYIR
jgi:4-hydroxybenzoate polyprenyltransferase